MRPAGLDHGLPGDREVVLPVLIYRVSGSPSLTALTTVLEGLPYLLFGLIAGALSDGSTGAGR